MLSERSKQTIKEEELFRHAIRAELEKKPSDNRSKLIVFFNTPFGLFLLSTVFVSFFTWVYSSISEARKIENQNMEKARHIKTEVYNRLKVFSYLLDTCDQIKMGELKGSVYGHSGGIHYYNIYEEFNPRNIRSLIIEARSLLPGSFSDKQLESIEYAFEILKKLERSTFYVTYFEKYGNGGSGSLTSIHYRLPPSMAKKYLELISDSFRFGEQVFFKHSFEAGIVKL